MITIPSGYIGFILFFILTFIIILPFVSFLVARKVIDNNQVKNNKNDTPFFKGLFSFQNFPIAVVFVVFSPVSIFFMLWAVSFLGLGSKMFIVIIYFLIQMLALIYILCKGGFEWKR